MAELSAGNIPSVANANTAKISGTSSGELAPTETFTSALARRVEENSTHESGAEKESDSKEAEHDPSSSETPALIIGSPPRIASLQISDRADQAPRFPGRSMPDLGAFNGSDNQSSSRLAGNNSSIDNASVDAQVGFSSAYRPADKSLRPANGQVDFSITGKDIALNTEHAITKPDAGYDGLADKLLSELSIADRLAVTSATNRSPESGMPTPSTLPNGDASVNALFGAARYAIEQDPSHFHIRTPISSSQWPTELDHVVRIMMSEKSSEAAIHIVPPELGPIDVVLKIEGDSATIAFSANQAETRSLLETHLPKLRELLSEAGIQLADASVSDWGTQRDSRGTSGSATFSQSFLNGANGESVEAVVGAGTDIRKITRSDRLIDTFA